MSYELWVMSMVRLFLSWFVLVMEFRCWFFVWRTKLIKQNNIYFLWMWMSLNKFTLLQYIFYFYFNLNYYYYFVLLVVGKQRIEQTPNIWIPSLSFPSVLKIWFHSICIYIFSLSKMISLTICLLNSTVRLYTLIGVYITTSVPFCINITRDLFYQVIEYDINRNTWCIIIR